MYFNILLMMVEDRPAKIFVYRIQLKFVINDINDEGKQISNILNMKKASYFLSLNTENSNKQRKNFSTVVERVPSGKC